MTASKIVQDYLKEIDIDITQRQAADIIELVLNIKFPASEGPIAKLYRFLKPPARDISGTGSWHHVFTQPVTQDEINAAIDLTTKIAPVMNIYMWECFNDQGELEGKIFTDRINIF